MIWPPSFIWLSAINMVSGPRRAIPMPSRCIARRLSADFLMPCTILLLFTETALLWRRTLHVRRSGCSAIARRVDNSCSPTSYLLGGSGTPVNQLAQNTVQQPQVIVQAQPIAVTQPQAANTPAPQTKKSDVDQNIPTGKLMRTHTFALIIANENYMEVANVPNALNDGQIFKEYCQKTLGIPESNIRYIPDATLNRMKRQLSWVTQVMEAYKGEANIIFYYAGHGIPDESNQSSYLLPVDGYGSDVTTGYSLDEIYKMLGEKKAKSVVVLLDACFSGANRDGAMLASARGVAIKSKQGAPHGKMVILSAAQGDETAYPYKEKNHGMFTYYLLKKLKDTKGDVTFGELADYVTSEVMKQSVVTNGKMQTPQAIPSDKAEDWKKWNFK